MAVMHDLVTDIDRRPVLLERAFDDLDGTFHSGAKAAGLGKDDANHAASFLMQSVSDVTPDRTGDMAGRAPCCNAAKPVSTVDNRGDYERFKASSCLICCHPGHPGHDNA
jgi:hypothetical protein